MKEAAEMYVLNETEKTVQNPVHPATKSECNPLHGDTQKCDVTPDDFADVHEFAGECRDRTNKVHWALLDLNQKPQVSDNKDVAHSPQSAMVHNTVHKPHFSPDLLEIIDRWDSLPEHIKAAIKALIQTHSTEAK